MLEQLADVHSDVHTREYWDFVAKRELRFQKCGGCNAFRFPPLTGCRECGATEVEWVAVAGRGRVFSYTIVHHPATPDIQEEVPLRVSVMAFGYLPLDTVFVPQRGERYLFELESDPQMERMIETQVERLEERSSALSAVLMRDVDRERLLRRRGTVGDLLEFDYQRYLPSCVFIDEEELIPTAPLRFFLGTRFVSDVHRIEFLFDGNMMRVYTREFIQNMIVRDVELREPIYVPNPFGDPFCR